jgi:ABC-type transport system involved in cytochrome c biogenesis permease subunit
MSEPAAARPIIRRGLATIAIALLGLAGIYLLALGFTPMEARQGLAQKIFYLHVPAAWSALLAFSLVGITSALYLWLPSERSCSRRARSGPSRSGAPGGPGTPGSP